MNVTVRNPLCRTPLALIVDDSCPVLNLGPFWIEQRHQWRQRHQPGTPAEAWEGDPLQAASQPRVIPAAFAARWGDWCGEQGIKGKFSLIPNPAGVGRIDQRLDGFSSGQLAEWLAVAREVIQPNFDLTPEMMTHTRVLDLKTGLLTQEWEQVEWVTPPTDVLEEYMTLALQILKNVGITAPGVTSPGVFGQGREAAYARATLDAALSVHSNSRPFYFLWHKEDEWPDVPLWYPEKEEGIALASIVSCAGDWFGGWTGYDGQGHADQFITLDLCGGRLPAVLERELPCILIGHWPGFYFGGREVGFAVLQEVKRRLDAFDPDKTRTLWMKTSEIAHYEMARQLSDITVHQAREGGEERLVKVSTRFPAERFTLEVGARLRRVVCNGQELREVHSQRNFSSGTFRVEGQHTQLAFDLSHGLSQLRCYQ